MAKTSAPSVYVTKYLPKINFHAAGSYGTYGHYRGVGLKLIARERYSAKDNSIDPCAFKTKKECMESQTFKKANREASLLRRASKRSLLPARFYEVGVYKIGRKWYAGIFMEHISGRLARKMRSWEKQARTIQVVIENLEQVGVKYEDHNANNFIFDRIEKIWRVIDFSPDWVKVVRMPEI